MLKYTLSTGKTTSFDKILGGDYYEKENTRIAIVIMLIAVIGFGCKFVYSQNEKVENKRFKDHVVFYPQHQDDEVLWGGTAIVDAIKECGADNVYVVLVSDDLELMYLSKILNLKI
ncbi:hypothetical protein H477_1864 [[Clostridium] sordellii ATCC 9714]|nr:hypothetical protein H477_1864 [[Clostridium] sordellii ATCC 9714] [Paeniclostridium sordellii ATCC 9714]